MKIFILASILLLCGCHSSNGKVENHSQRALVQVYLEMLTTTNIYRNYEHPEQLNKTANMIESVFAKFADTVYTQEYKVEGKIYKNVICSFGTKNTKRIIVGAHYDVCGNQLGADDNASGVVGLLELARLLKGQQLNYRIDLVAYTLEEPPFFRTEFMGSYVHAKSLVDEKADVYGMVSLEMIGYFKDEPHSQNYPIKGLSLLYGNKGNFITLVSKFWGGFFANEFCNTFESKARIETKRFKAPAFVTGVDFSDHLNYWKLGFNAIMITDTAFMRNPNYHQPTDMMETLDLDRMGKVIDAVFETLIHL
jgi:hypothetical protein